MSRGSHGQRGEGGWGLGWQRRMAFFCSLVFCFFLGEGGGSVLGELINFNKVFLVFCGICRSFDKGFFLACLFCER